MSNSRQKLSGLWNQVDESMGQRAPETAETAGTVAQSPQFSPIPSPRDIGRQPSRSFGPLALDRLMPDPKQPRHMFDEQEISRLAESLKHTGQLQPIRVRWSDAQQKWIIIAGERRYRAALLAGLKSIDCYFEENELSISKTLEQQLIENLQREDLNSMEEAQAYSELMQINHWNGKQLAASLHISPSRISRAVALLSLPDDVRQQIQTGELTASTAYELTKITDPTLQKKLAGDAIGGTATQRDIAATLKHQRKTKRRSTAGVNLTFLADNGIRVQVRSPRRQNYHEVLEALQQALEDVQFRIDSQIFL